MSKKSLDNCLNLIKDAYIGFDRFYSYTHIKTKKIYIIERIVLREKDLEPLVIYAPSGYEAVMFARPLSEFKEKFVRNEYSEDGLNVK